MSIKQLSEKYKDYIINQRRWFHMHPELSMQEVKTTKHIVSELKSMGIEVHTFSDFRGAVGIIRGSKPGKTVMLRADIDALPICERTGKPYASINQGVMHACGHDCHAAMLLGAAKILMEEREQLCGNVKLLFQVGEETGVHSVLYVKAGELDDVDGVFGMHIWALLEAGTVNFEEGERMASSDRFVITVKGQAAHGSAPHQGHDAIVAASSIVMGLQTLVSRVNDPLNSLVITVGMMNGGQRFNIIADKVEMVGTVRTFNPDFRNKMADMMQKFIDDIASAHGCTAHLEYVCMPGPVINDHTELVGIARGAAAKILGDSALVSLPKMMGAEDFSGLMEAVPGVFGFLGARNRNKGIDCTHHNPLFDVDEEVLHDGAAIYAQFAKDFLQRSAD